MLIEPAIRVMHLGMRTGAEIWALWRRDALGCGAVTAHIALAGSPIVAAHVWWWYIGRIWWSGMLHAMTLRAPTGLRLAWWMTRSFCEGFWAEWQAQMSGATLCRGNELVRRGNW